MKSGDTPTKKALTAAVNAVYFGDNSDYLSALHEVIKELLESDRYASEDDIRQLFDYLNDD